MDTFKIIVIIFLMILTYQIYQINCVVFKDNFEGFEGSAQNVTSGIDDTNAINTLAQIAKNLMAGGVTVPGNMRVSGDISTGEGKVSINNGTINLTSDGGGGLYFLKSGGVVGDKAWNKLHTGDIFVNGNNNISGNLNAGGNVNVSGTTTTSVLNLGNKFRLSGTGDAHGNDDWIRLFGVDNKGYQGGIAMNKCHIQTADFMVAGRNILGELNALNDRVKHLNLGNYTLNDEGPAFTIRHIHHGERAAFYKGQNYR
jgi:hypothetical protein